MRIRYIARCEKARLPGVFNKIEQTVLTLCAEGHQAKLECIEISPTVKSIFKMFAAIVVAKEELLIIRFDMLFVALLPAIVLKKIQGARINVDIPTPISTGLKEIQRSNESIGKKIIKSIIIVLTCPASLWVSNKVIQYGPESKYFSIGLKKKTKLSTNGICVESVKLKESKNTIWSNSFVMIGVASLAEWHGYDRVIRGMADYVKNMSSGELKPVFNIVGEGDAKEGLKELVYSLHLNEYVNFFGYMSGEQLDHVFNNSDVGVSSLGLYRKDLNLASDLKSREYCARGMPFIKTGIDIDFDPKPFFVHQVENNNEDVDIRVAIDWFTGLDTIEKKYSEKIRKYAREYIDYTVKTQYLM